jgi:hypothetical protein
MLKKSVNPKKEVLSKAEKQGIKMIQFLQKQTGINESHEDALAGWRKMSEGEKATTERVYNMFK